MKNCNTIEFLKFIPTITCYSPKAARAHIGPNGGNNVVMKVRIRKSKYVGILQMHFTMMKRKYYLINIRGLTST